MSRREWTGIVVLGLVAATACGGAAEEAGMEGGQDAETLREARADSVARAEEAYRPAAFDSITWRSEDERFTHGENVWNFSCGDCHGWEGRGDGPVATRHEYDVPDFTDVGWDAGDVDSLRHRVYVGHESEMPSWGLYGLTYRDIDATTYYVDQKFGGDGP